MSNVSFHGATFVNVNFNGVTIDGATLESLLPAIRKGSISLDGTKIIGSLDNIDLKGISFNTADLSEVTSMKGTNLSKTNLIAAILPADSDILAHSFGLQSARFNTSILTDDINRTNQERISAIITEKLTKKFQNKVSSLSDSEISKFNQKVSELYGDTSKIGKRLRKAVNAYPEQLLSQSFPENPQSISHVSQYKGQASHQLSLIYNNIKHPENIEAALVSDIIAEKITTNLFGKGSNRGKDGLEIQKTLETAIADIANEYGISPKEILSNPKMDLMLEELTEEIYSKTKRTMAGMATGGIYLPEGAIKAEDLKPILEKTSLPEEAIPKKIANQIIAKAKENGIEAEDKDALITAINNIYQDQSNIGIRFREALEKDPDVLLKAQFPEDIQNISHFSDFKGTASHQLSIIYNNINSPSLLEASLAADIISDQITGNLFDTGQNRGQDALQIQEAVTDIVIQFSKENNVSIKDILETRKLSDFISELTEDIRSKTRYTTAGMVSGGIYLPDNAISSDMVEDFAAKMNIAIGDHALTTSEQRIIDELADSIATNIFGSDAKETNIKDINQITELLEKSFYDLKASNSEIDLESTITASKDTLVGRLDRGYISTTGEGLTKLFYDNTTYTGGSLSNSIQTADFKINLKQKIEESIENNIVRNRQKTQKVKSNVTKQAASTSIKDKAIIIGSEIQKHTGRESIITNKANLGQRRKSNTLGR